MNLYFPHLFSELTIRNHTYRNRIETAPTMFAQACFMPEIADNIFSMIEGRAAGGAGAVCVGEIGVNNKEGSCFNLVPTDYHVHEGPYFEAAKKYASLIHKHGAVAMAEFSHEGQDANQLAFNALWGGESGEGSGHVAYGPIDMVRPDGGVVKAFDEESMSALCEDLEISASFARAAGFDGVLLHGGHGYLVQQFISPLFNKRTDAYGGSIENRAKFPIRMFEALRKGLGEDGILELRMSAEDRLPGGMTIDDVVEFAKLLDGKIDVFHCSCGIKLMGNRTNTFSDMYEVHGVNVEYARQIKAVLKQTKVGVIGGLNSPEQCEEIIASGAADLVIFGRQMFADPEFANKAAGGRADEIRRCVRCYQCYPGIAEHETDVDIFKDLSPEEAKKASSPASMGKCAINPRSNLGFCEAKQPKPAASRRVLIAGGGPAGMQAAITATERGHQVTLLEKTDRLGGIINFTENDPCKTDLRNVKNVLIREVEKSGAQIRTGQALTEDVIKEIRPDQIILAVGSVPVRMPVAGGEDLISALGAYDVLDEIGETVLLIGGGVSGCELGVTLARAGHKVTVAEMGARLCPSATGMYRAGLLDEMDRCGIGQLLSHTCTKITEKGAYFTDPEGNEIFCGADTIINACGMKRVDTQELVRMCGDIPVVQIGDCAQVGKVGSALSAAYHAALEIL